MKRVLLTGMSGTGKSTIVNALAARDYKAVDLDCDEFSHWIKVIPSTKEMPVEPERDWVWREDRVQNLLSTEDAEVLFVSGCAKNMGRFLPQFDHVVLLFADAQIIVNRLATRTNNAYGKQPQEVNRVLALLQTVEPLLRNVATCEIDTSASVEEVVAAVLHLVQK